MKKLLLALLLSSATLVQAQPWNAPGAGRSAMPSQPAGSRFAADSPAALTQKGLESLLDYLQNGDGNLKKLAIYLETHVAPYFDFGYMARAAAGNLYRQMDQEQRRKLANRIKRQFLASMVDRLGEYDRQQVRVVSQRLSRDGRTGVVSAAIHDPRGYPARMDFRFYRSGDGWKVYDVSANGQSAVVYYRNQFRQMMYRPAAGRGLAARPGYPRAR